MCLGVNKFMNKTKPVIFVSLITILIISGCIGQSSNTETAGKEVSVERSVEMMKDMMENSPELMNTTNQNLIIEDQTISGTVARSGKFQNLNYMTDGSVFIMYIDGHPNVVFGEDFSTPDGPNLVLYLTKNSGKTTRDDIRAGIELMPLKSTKGMQVYELPDGIDIGQYNSVTIHCKAFNVPWSYAPLEIV